MVEDCSKEVLFLHVRYTISFSIALKLYPALFDCAVHSMFKSILGSVIPSSRPTFLWLFSIGKLDRWEWGLVSFPGLVHSFLAVRNSHRILYC